MSLMIGFFSHFDRRTLSSSSMLLSSSSPLGNEGVGIAPLFSEGKEGRGRGGSSLDGGGGEGSGTLLDRGGNEGRGNQLP